MAINWHLVGDFRDVIPGRIGEHRLQRPKGWDLVVFVSGNLPFKTEIVPLIIVSKLEQYDYAGATAVACIMLVLSFSLLLFINLLQKWAKVLPTVR